MIAFVLAVSTLVLGPNFALSFSLSSPYPMGCKGTSRLNYLSDADGISTENDQFAKVEAEFSLKHIFHNRLDEVKDIMLEAAMREVDDDETASLLSQRVLIGRRLHREGIHLPFDLPVQAPRSPWVSRDEDAMSDALVSILEIIGSYSVLRDKQTSKHSPSSLASDDHEDTEDELIAFEMLRERAAFDKFIKGKGISKTKAKATPGASQTPFHASVEPIEEYSDDHCHPIDFRFFYTGSVGLNRK